MIILPDMMSWPHFVQLPNIRNLPINEQTRMYNQYLAEQQTSYAQVMAHMNAVGSGGTPTTTTEAPEETTTTTTEEPEETTTTTTEEPEETTTTTTEEPG